MDPAFVIVEVLTKEVKVVLKSRVVVPAARASMPRLNSFAAAAVGTQEAVTLVFFVVVLSEVLEIVTVDAFSVVELVTSAICMVVLLVTVLAFWVTV